MRVKRYVLDSYAILAFFLGEPAGQQVKELLQQAQFSQITLGLSLINYGECLYSVERRYGSQATLKLQMLLDALPISYYPADHQRVLSAAWIKAYHPLSYADAFAVALAQELQATVVTGDPEFHTVEQLIDVLWL